MAVKSPLPARALAEFLGTGILVTTVLSCVMGGNPLAVLGIASALMIAIYGTGEISGGHLNPAVSLGVLLTSLVKHTDFSVLEFLVYVMSQLCGALVAALLTLLMWTTAVGGPSSTKAGSGYVLAGNLTHPFDGKVLGTNITNAQATEGGLFSVGLAEIIYTAVLVFVVLNVATCGDEGEGMTNNYFGLAIGFVINAGGVAVGQISMGAFNPAVAFALAIGALISGNLPSGGYAIWWPIVMFLFYFAMEYIGAILAVLFFYICRRGQWGKKKGDHDLCSKFMAEFLGTFVLCLTVMLVINTSAGVQGPIAIGSSLMVMIYALGAVSGANFNPAVSIGLACIRAITCIEFVVYVVAQLLGGLCAFFTTWLMLRRIDSSLVAKDVPAGSPKFGVIKGSWVAVLLAELIFTGILVFTVMNVAVRDAPNQYYGLAIGFVVVAGAIAVGGLSGGAFNPAVAFTIDLGGLADNEYAGFGWCFVYMAVQLIAGCVAGLLHKCMSAGRGNGKGYDAMIDAASFAELGDAELVDSEEEETVE